MLRHQGLLWRGDGGFELIETRVYLAKGDVTNEIVLGSGVVCLLGDQWHNTSRRATIFKASIRLVLILRIVFFSTHPFPVHYF